MTLLEIKKQSLALIEELNEDSEYLTDDPDIQAKLNYVINQIQIELSQIKRINAKHTFNYEDINEFDLPSDFYQINKINCEYEIYDKKILLDTNEDKIDMYYYKYPTVINSDTSDDYEMEISLDCLNAMPYGVASDLLKSDPSVDYSIYATRYNELKNGLRLSNSSPMVFVDTTNAMNDTSISEF